MLRSPLLGQTIGGPENDFNVQETTEEGCPREGPRPLAPLHLHRDDDEAFYVLEGRLVIQLDGDEKSVPAGACLLVPKGTPHTYWNPDPAPVRYLLVMPPRLRSLVDAFDEDPNRPRAEMQRLYEEFDSQLMD